ncbi:MAG: hypothetical protein R2755_28505 [Acidimicrobiales bacterium]
MIIATGDGTSIDARRPVARPCRGCSTPRVAFGDLTGNNRLDSFNLVQHPAIGMIFFVPGTEAAPDQQHRPVEAPIELRRRCEIDGRVPNVAVEVTVQECYVHCGAACARSAIWDTATWPAVKPIGAGGS